MSNSSSFEEFSGLSNGRSTPKTVEVVTLSSKSGGGKYDT